MIGDRPAVIGQNDDRFLALHEIPEALRQRGPHARRALNRIGKFRRMGRGESDDRGRRRGAEGLSRGANADRGVRVDDHAARAVNATHLLGAGGLIDPERVEVGANAGQRFCRDGE